MLGQALRTGGARVPATSEGAPVSQNETPGNTAQDQTVQDDPAPVVDPNAAAQAALAEIPAAQKAADAMGVGIIGTGVISEQYLTTFRQVAGVDVRFLADIDLEKARQRAEQFDIRTEDGALAIGTVEELLAREDIDIVVNLTIPSQHAGVDRQILEAGKHVWSEKPIALDAEESHALLALAEEKGLRLAVAPDTMLGPGIQNGLRALADGRIGEALTGSFVFQTGGPESWHPSPEFLFTHGAGPLFDMGPYYISAAVRLLGPVTRVAALASTARATRVIGSGPRAGTEFPVDVPTHHAALLGFASGASAQCVFSFQSALSRVGEIEVSGTTGSIRLPDPNVFDGASTVWSFAEGPGEPEVQELEPEGPVLGRGVGVVDLARSIRAGMPEQASGRLAAHVLDVLLAIRDSAAEGRIVEVDATGVVVPEALPADWDPRD